MVSTPKRPPGRPRSERRKPKGPSTVALRPDDQKRRDNLVAAADTLRTTGHPDLAGAVDYVLSPLGRGFLARLNPPSNLPIGMPETYKALIEKAAAKEAKAKGETVPDVLAAVLDEGFDRWLAGDFVLKLEPKVGKGKGAKRVVLNTRPSGEGHAKVAARCRDMKGERFAPGRNVTTSNVAAHALYEHFGIGPYAPDADGDK